MNLGILGKDYDLHIHIEDTQSKYIWESILKRLFQARRIKVYNHYAQDASGQLLGGKRRLKEAFEISLRDPASPQLFIADLDFDELVSAPEMIMHPQFMYLRRYSIENYLVEEMVPTSYLNARLNLGEEVCASEVQFSEWLRSFSAEYRSVIVLFILVQELNLGLSNVKDKHKELIDEVGQPRRTQIRKYLKEVIKEFRNRGYKRIATHFRDIESRIEDKYGDSIWIIIPGRHLLRALIGRMKSVCARLGKAKEQFSQEELTRYAAFGCSVHELGFIRKQGELICLNHRRNPNGEEIAESSVIV